MRRGIVKELIIIGGIIVGVGVFVTSFFNKENSDDSIVLNERIESISSTDIDKSNDTIIDSNVEIIEHNKNNFDLINSTQSIFEGSVDVSIVKVEYNNDILTIYGQIENNSDEDIKGHVSEFYFKDSNGVIKNLDFFENPTFNINAPTGGKTNFQMVYKNIKLDGDNFSIGGEFFKFGYFGSDKKMNLEVRF